MKTFQKTERCFNTYKTYEEIVNNLSKVSKPSSSSSALRVALNFGCNSVAEEAFSTRSFLIHLLYFHTSVNNNNSTRFKETYRTFSV